MSQAPRLTYFCCNYDRRHFLQLAGASLATAFPLASRAVAAPKYEAVLLTCIDQRAPALLLNYMKGRDLTGKYAHFRIEGAAIGAVAEPFKDGQRAFWETFGRAIARDDIKKIIALDHRDCETARVTYGLGKSSDRLIETETHRAALAEFRKQAERRYPGVEVEIGLMAPDGKVEMFPAVKKPAPVVEPEPAPAPAPPAEAAIPANPAPPVETVTPASPPPAQAAEGMVSASPAPPPAAESVAPVTAETAPVSPDPAPAAAPAPDPVSPANTAMPPVADTPR